MPPPLFPPAMTPPPAPIPQASHSSKYSSETKRLWLFTNDDDPTKGDEAAAQGTAQVGGSDMVDQGVEVSLWAIDRRGRPFDPSRFYSRLLVAEEGEGGGDGGLDTSRLERAGEWGFAKVGTARALLLSTHL